MTALDRPILYVKPGEDAREAVKVFRHHLGVTPIVVRRKPAEALAVRLPQGVSARQYRSAFKALTGVSPEKHASDTYADYWRHRDNNILPQKS